MFARPKADVIYIGYPKAASTFVGRFLEQHPQVTTDHLALRPLYAPTAADTLPAADDKPDAAKIHISMNEKVAESICLTGDRNVWRTNQFVPNTWDVVKTEILLDPGEAARRLKHVQPAAKILMVIRERIDWLHSSYKFFMPRLPPGRRSFVDFCATPRGIAYLQAGFFDRTIEAYADVFGAERVKVLRFEDIASAPQAFTSALCGYLGIAEQAIPSTKENEGSSIQAAKIRQRFPMVDRLPLGLRAAVRPLISLLPAGRKTLLSDNEIRMLRNIYALSTQRTDRLVPLLGRPR